MLLFRKMLFISRIKKTIAGAFPQELRDDINTVLKSLAVNNLEKPVNRTDTSAFLLLTGEQIQLPYRIYLGDGLKHNAVLTPKQQLIYHCIFSRSSDGFVREKHIMSLLKAEISDWCMPYIFKVCGEYVVEILDDVYAELTTKDNTKIIEFCKLNLEQLLYNHARMISYWDVFYRDKWYRYDNYVGKKLFSECFGYSRCLEKLRKR